MAVTLFKKNYTQLQVQASHSRAIEKKSNAEQEFKAQGRSTGSMVLFSVWVEIEKGVQYNICQQQVIYDHIYYLFTCQSQCSQAG